MYYFTERLLDGLEITHGYVVGGTGSGKTSFLQWLMRELISRRLGFCYIDWHGKAYNDLLSYLAYLRPNVPIYLLDPASDFVQPYNPFIDRGSDLATHLSRCVSAVIRPWGASSTNATPRLARISEMLFHFATVSGETLPNAWQVLFLPASDVRSYARTIANDPTYGLQWEELESIKGVSGWLSQAESTRNRLMRFLSSARVKRHLAFKSGNLDIPKIMESGGVFLANVPVGILDAPVAQSFAALLLLDIFQAAMQRVNRKHRRFYLVCDEFQNYVTPEIPYALDQSLKGGLRLLMAHQRMGQLAEVQGIENAIYTNAQVSLAFGSMQAEAAAGWAKEHMLPELNRDAKAGQLAERIKDQKRRHCVVKLPGMRAEAWEVPTLSEYHARDKERYVSDIFRAQGAVTVADADAELARSAAEFKLKVDAASGKKPPKPKKQKESHASTKRPIVR